MKNDYTTIQVTPATPTIGADVHGIALCEPLNADQLRDIRQALLDHLVLFFREQKPIPPERQIALGRYFGELHHHPSIPHLPGYPGVLLVRADKDSKGIFGPAWHSDVSCDEQPPLGTILQIHMPPPLGGNTLFANMYAAYERLSPPMRHFLEGLSAVHESYEARTFAADGAPVDSKEPARAVHPVVRTHPETGRSALFVNRIFTKEIVSLSPAESRTLLELLLRQIEDPYLQVRLHWQANDVAFWDNRCVQHIAIWDYWPHERAGHRVTILGDKPFFKPAAMLPDSEAKAERPTLEYTDLLRF